MHKHLCLICQYRVCEWTNTRWSCAVQATRCAPVVQAAPPSEDDPPFMRNVFLSHGGPSFIHVRAVRDLLDALDFVPVIAQELRSFGLSVHEKVQGWMRICRTAIVLATVDDKPAGNSRTRPNIENSRRATPKRCGSSLTGPVFSTLSLHSSGSCERSRFDIVRGLLRRPVIAQRAALHSV